MKLKSIVVLILTGLFLSSCTDDKQGTSSGGGGFTDTSARVYLDLAKYSLAEIIQNSSNEIYKGFPNGKGKAWLIETIKKTEIKNVPKKRYGRNLKFDYDEKSQVVYATRDFIQTVENQRPWTLNAKSKVEILLNIHLDILHEISHLYGIGTKESTNVDSAAWAKSLLFDHIGTEKVACINNEVITMNKGTNEEEKILARAIVFNPSTGFSYYGKIEYENQMEDFDRYNDLALQLILPPGLQYEADESDFIYQYFALVNLALKHTTIDKLKDVVSSDEDLKLEAIVDLMYVWDSISDWNLMPLGHVEQVNDEQFKYTAYDDIEYSSSVIESNNVKTQGPKYVFQQEYTLLVDRKNMAATFSKTLISTDTESEKYLKANPNEGFESVNLECEYYVKPMEFK